MRGRHPYTWGQDHPLVIDGLLALVLAAIGVATEVVAGPDPVLRNPDDLSGVLTLATTLPLVLRRRHPLAVFGVVAVAATAYFIAEYPGIGPILGWLFVLYGVGAYVRRRTAVYCLLITMLVVVGGTLTSESGDGIPGAVGVSGVFLAAWVLGDNMRVRRAYIAAVEDRAAQLEREQDAQARRAVLEERTRIARELHDVVAHSMSVMVVQAGAARRTLERDRARAVEAIGHIESTGRGALAEMRRLVGVLRSSGDRGAGVPPDRRGVADAGEDAAGHRPDVTGEADQGQRLSGAEAGPLLLPQPDIDQLPGLVSQCRDAGLDVALRTDGRERPLPSGIELVVYRIVQEALTNTMRHAGPARAEVHLHYGGASIAVSVTDDGRGAAANGWHHEPGHGLAGMHERVSIYGGQIATGPRPGGGFRVWAEIPLTDAGTDADADADATEPDTVTAEADRPGPEVATGTTAP